MGVEELDDDDEEDDDEEDEEDDDDVDRGKDVGMLLITFGKSFEWVEFENRSPELEIFNRD